MKQSLSPLFVQLTIMKGATCYDKALLYWEVNIVIVTYTIWGGGGTFSFFQNDSLRKQYAMYTKDL